MKFLQTRGALIQVWTQNFSLLLVKPFFCWIWMDAFGHCWEIPLYLQLSGRRLTVLCQN